MLFHLFITCIPSVARSGRYLRRKPTKETLATWQSCCSHNPCHARCNDDQLVSCTSSHVQAIADGRCRRLFPQAQGFALFHSPGAAHAACEMLSHMSFDEHTSIRCEIARKNMYYKDAPVHGPPSHGPPPHSAPHSHHHHHLHAPPPSAMNTPNKRTRTGAQQCSMPCSCVATGVVPRALAAVDVGCDEYNFFVAFKCKQHCPAACSASTVPSGLSSLVSYC